MSEYQLDEETHNKVRKFCAQGDQFLDAKRYDDALKQYNMAWALVPDPKEEWEASTWILAAIGDTCWLGSNSAEAQNAFDFALTCPSGLGNPFIHLRLGQIHFDSNNLERAADELTRAYMGAGMEIFGDADPKYFEFLRTRISI